MTYNMFSFHPKRIKNKNPSPLISESDKQKVTSHPASASEKSVLQKLVTQFQQSHTVILLASVVLLLTSWADTAERE